MADRGRPKNISTLLTDVQKGLKSSDVRNLERLRLFCEARDLKTFDQFFAHFSTTMSIH